jgi:hypothetical protein
MEQLFYGEAEVSIPMEGVFDRLSAEKGKSPLELAGELVGTGFDGFRNYEWQDIDKVRKPIYEVFGHYPDGTVLTKKTIVPYFIDMATLSDYLDWCSRNPVNVPGILALGFQAGFATQIIEAGLQDELGIEKVSTARYYLDLDFRSHQLGLGRCMDHDDRGGFGGCLDRGPNW